MGTAQPLRPADPRQLGPYELTGRLGSGGMGIVYAARTQTPDGRERLVAVKVIHPHLADAPEFRTRFRSEAALAARVARFCTAAVLDVDVEGEQPYLVTEFVDGPTLQEVVEEQGPLSGSALDALAIGIAVALIAIHEAGIIHRDLKPSNVVLSRFGPRVIDFGIARAADVVTGLTSGVIGSPPYMAPEQFRGEQATTATDVHAWGAVVCFAGTAQPPLGVAAPEVMLYRALHQDIDVGGLDEPIRTLVQAALSKDPSSRPTARGLLERLAVGSPGAVAAVPAPAVHPAAAEGAGPGQNAGAGRGVRPPDATTTQLTPQGPLTALEFTAPRQPTRRKPVEPAPPDADVRPGIHARPDAEVPVGSLEVPTPRRRGGRWVLVSAAVLAALAVAAGAAVWAGPWRHQSRSVAHPQVAADQAVRQYDADDSATGPAPPVAGARRGGTVTLYASSGEWHLDPAQNSFPDAMMASSRLLNRTLTSYREDGKGRATLVGDLATDTGRTTDGGKTWDYTLRPGLTFSDGRPVTAADVAYGMARSFRASLQGGPSYLQQWLTGRDAASFRDVYPGPSAAAPYPPGVKVLGRYGLRLTFATPHPDLPAVASLPNTAAVPPTGAPLATGPYRVVTTANDQLVLGRNTHWDAATDPIRTPYPDKYVVRFGGAKTTVTDLFLADAEPDRGSIQLATIDPSRAKDVYKPGATGRLVSGTGLHRDLCFNTQRVTDSTVRHALAVAFNREAALTPLGGPYVGDLTSSLLSRRLPGFPTGDGQSTRSGDPEAARTLLGGRSVTLTLGYRNDSQGEGKRFAQAVRDMFALAGVDVTLKPIRSDVYEKTLATRDNPYDAYFCGWGPDYLDGNAMLAPRYQGATIRAIGNTNVTYLDVPEINTALDHLATLPDRKEAAKRYFALERTIREKYTPAIPIFDQRRLSLRGSEVHDTSFSQVWGVPDLAHVWVGVSS